MATAKPVLDANDLRSSTWVKLRAHLNEELARMRIKNDNDSYDAVETAKIRGDIARLKKMLGLEKDTEYSEDE